MTTRQTSHWTRLRGLVGYVVAAFCTVPLAIFGIGSALSWVTEIRRVDPPPSLPSSLLMIAFGLLPMGVFTLMFLLTSSVERWQERFAVSALTAACVGAAVMLPILARPI